MGRTACTEPQCLYKGALYLSFLTYIPIALYVRNNTYRLLTLQKRDSGFLHPSSRRSVPLMVLSTEQT